MTERTLAHQLIRYVEATTDAVRHHGVGGESSTTRHPQPPSTARLQAALDAKATCRQAGEGHLDPDNSEMIMLAPLDDEPHPGRSRLLLAAAVIAVAAIAGLLLAATRSDDDSLPADQPAQLPTTHPARSIPLTGAEDDPAAQDAFAIVQNAFAAYNSGDMRTWATRRDGVTAVVHDFTDEAARGGRLDVDSCEYKGLGAWRTGEFPLLSGHGFVCEVTHTDRFLHAAGIELEARYGWIVAEDLSQSVAGSTEDFRPAGLLMSRFRNWLEANLPEVAASIQYGRAFPLAASVPIATTYIEEFVADSDFYPLTGPVPPASNSSPLEPAE